MVDLIDKFKEGGITVKDICLDPCCGSGTFLLTFMKKQLSIEGVDEEKVKENLIGIERNEQMYLLSIANMLTREDGKANLQLKSFFDDDLKLPCNPTIGLMNPPYSQTDYREIEFIRRLLNKCAESA